MKFALPLFAALIASAAQAANFQCDNMPSSRWGDFYCAYGEFTGTEITYMTFGICRGSADAGEMDEITVSEFQDGVKADPALKASSPEWKNANAYDVSFHELGEATLYIQPEAFVTSGYTLGRVKHSVMGKTKNVMLNCSFNQTFPEAKN